MVYSQLYYNSVNTKITSFETQSLYFILQSWVIQSLLVSPDIVKTVSLRLSLAVAHQFAQIRLANNISTAPNYSYVIYVYVCMWKCFHFVLRRLVLWWQLFIMGVKYTIPSMPREIPHIVLFCFYTYTHIHSPTILQKFMI